MSSPHEAHISRSRPEDYPSNMTIVDDLINGINDWRSVQDIVRLTFKALSDIVKSQGQTLKDLELQMPSKASKSDLSSCLSVKSSQSEIFRSISELKSSIDSKMAIDQVYSLLDEKVNKTEMQYLLSSKASYEETRSIFCEKSDLREIQAEIRGLRGVVEDSNQEHFSRIQKCAGIRDLQDFQADFEERLRELTEEKANKNSVANALHRKANKSDLEQLINTKVSLSDFNELILSLQDLKSEISTKVNKIEYKSLIDNDMSNKLEKSEFEEAFNSIHTLRKELENKTFLHLSSLEGSLSSLRSELEDLQSSVKSDSTTLQSTIRSLHNKPDLDEINTFLSTLRSEMLDSNASIRTDFHKYQDFCNERLLKSEQVCKSIQEEISRVHECLRSVSEKAKEHIEESLRSYQAFTLGKLEDVKYVGVDLENLKKEFNELRLSKADRNEIRKGLERKLEHRDVQEFFDKGQRTLQIGIEETREMLKRKEKELVMLIDSKPGVHEINSLILESSLNHMKKEMKDEGFYEERLMRSSNDIWAKDKCSSDLKSYVASLESRVSNFIFEQNGINETLCAESCIGRWLWRAGDLKSGLISWEVESVNTCPENFIWDFGCTVTLAATGLYEVNFGVFSSKKPEIEVLLNGEAVYKWVEAEEKGRVRRNGKVIAASAVLFVAAPTKSIISLAYSSEASGEGFLAVKKL